MAALPSGRRIPAAEDFFRSKPRIGISLIAKASRELQPHFRFRHCLRHCPIIHSAKKRGSVDFSPVTKLNRTARTTHHQTVIDSASTMTDMTENIEAPPSAAGLHNVPHESPDQNTAPHIVGQGLPTNAEDQPSINSEWIRSRLTHWGTGLRDPDLLPGLYRNQEGRLCRLPISADERKQALFDTSFADPLSEDNVLIQENISVRRFRHLEYLSILHYQNELLATQLEVERAKGFTSDEQMMNVRRVLKEYRELTTSQKLQSNN